MAKQADCVNFGPKCQADSSKPFQCKDLSCVASPQECAKNPALIAPVSIEYDLNVVEAASIEFAYLDRVPIARLMLPSDSISVPEGQISATAGYHRLRFEPIPTNSLNKIRNFVDRDFSGRLSSMYNVNADSG